MKSCTYSYNNNDIRLEWLIKPKIVHNIILICITLYLGTIIKTYYFKNLRIYTYQYKAVQCGIKQL